MPVTVTTSHERQSSIEAALSTKTDGPADGLFAPVPGAPSKAQSTPCEDLEKSAWPRDSLSIAYLTVLAFTYIDMYLTQILYTVGVAIVLAGYVLL